MTPKVAIADYGLGNLFSINQACEHVSLKAVVTSEPQLIKQADALILPGVGAFGDAMTSLKENNLVEPILEFVKSGKPFLGICLGMQLLFTKSEEFGTHEGLGIVDGTIVKFPERDSEGKVVRVPQIQWNKIDENPVCSWDESPLKAVSKGTYMHFVHSYYALPARTDNVLCYSEYAGIRYASAVISNNVVGMQFHPEKSGANGLKIYDTWAHFIKSGAY